MDVTYLFSLFPVLENKYLYLISIQFLNTVSLKTKQLFLN